ncbi:hypothetical protein [Paenibacillus sp. P36]|uniref:hypothetical protein n=1 Tax=Paenibacillus sp. P36 TaxID=3342538 RepID=UPI0038B39378
MKHFVLFFTIFTLFSILGCTSQTVNIKETSSKNAEPTNTEYAVGLTSPGNVNKNTDFKLEAKFTNNKDSEIRITHGEQLFTFYIADKKGNTINHYPIKSLGVVRGIPSKGTVVEPYTFNIDVAGEYEVWAVANFEISENNANKKHQLPTLKQALVVR